MTFENIKFKCIKGLAIDNVSTRTLSEIGFPVDAPKQPDMRKNIDFINFFHKTYDSPFSVVGEVEKIYINSLIETRSREKAFSSVLAMLGSLNVNEKELAADLQSGCVYGLEPREAEILIDEFVFIIEKLLPRQLSDIYYSFDIEPNPAYAVFFDFAAEKLEKNTHSDIMHSGNRDFLFNSIKHLFSSGETMLSIYKSTCATKNMIKDAINVMPHNAVNSVELTLFSLSKQYSYKRTLSNDGGTFFELYKDDQKIFDIFFISEDRLDCIDSYPEYLSELDVSKYPLLVIDPVELFENYPSDIIRKAIKEPEYIAKHNSERIKSYIYEKAINCRSPDYKTVEKSKVCGCFSCGAIFSPKDITDWYFCDDDGIFGCPYCPKCNEDTVITDGQGFEINSDFIRNLADYYETYY